MPMLYTSISQPEGHDLFWDEQPFTGVKYQLSCTLETYITIYNSRKSTVMK